MFTRKPGVGPDSAQVAARPIRALWRSTLIDAWSVHLYATATAPGTRRGRRPDLRPAVADRALARQPGPTSLSGSPNSAGEPTLVPDAVSEDTQAVHPRRTRAGEDGMGVVRHPGLRLHLDATRAGRRVQPAQPGWLSQSRVGAIQSASIRELRDASRPARPGREDLDPRARLRARQAPDTLSSTRNRAAEPATASDPPTRPQ